MDEAPPSAPVESQYQTAAPNATVSTTDAKPTQQAGGGGGKKKKKGKK